MERRGDAPTFRVLVWSLRIGGPSTVPPKGPRTQITGFKGPDTILSKGIWALKPYYLGPLTLRGRHTGGA